MKYLLILGARSDLARALARRYASEGWALMLAGRDKPELERDAADLKVRYQVPVSVCMLNGLTTEGHASFYANLPAIPNGVICAIGLLGDQTVATRDEEHAQLILATNFNGCVSLLGGAAKLLAERGSGFIVGIGSVAGDRGRKSNYYYGSAKAGLAAWLSGLRNSLAKTDILVLTVKPGFIATKMTEGLKLPPLLTAQPDEVANDIYNAVIKGKDTLYTKWFWRYIMLIIRHIPEAIFKRLSL